MASQGLFRAGPWILLALLGPSCSARDGGAPAAPPAVASQVSRPLAAGGRPAARQLTLRASSSPEASLDGMKLRLLEVLEVVESGPEGPEFARVVRMQATCADGTAVTVELPRDAAACGFPVELVMAGDGQERPDSPREGFAIIEVQASE